MSCGRLCPAYDLNAGQTVSSTLLYGVPTAFFTIGVPIIAGCKPANAYYVYDNTKPPAKLSLEYVPDAGDIPLIARATSNVTSVPSFNLTWEPQPNAVSPAPKVRPAGVRIFEIDGDTGVTIRQQVSFKYDERGRLTRCTTKPVTVSTSNASG